MGSLSVRGVDEELAQRLKTEAKAAKMSVNKLVVRILRQHLGLDKAKRYSKEHHDLDHLFGMWPDEEFEKVQGKILASQKTDEEMWK